MAALLLVLAVVGLQCAGGMGQGFLEQVLVWAGSGLPVGWKPVILGGINAVAFTVVLLVGWQLTQAPAKEVFFLRPVRVSLLAAMLLTTLGAHILLSELDNLLRVVLPMPAILQQLYGEVFGSANLAGSLFLMVLVAPITEELLFRGLILRGLLSRYRPSTAVFASAFLFSVFHLNPWQMLGAFFLGALFAWWVLQVRSLWPCLLAHALNNALSATAGRLPLDIPGYTSSLQAVGQFHPGWFDLLGFSLALFGLAGTAVMLRKTR